jgi:hypothetical protein
MSGRKQFQRRATDKRNRTMLRVPNTEEGREFLRLLRYYSATGTRVTVRGRGPRAHASREKYGERYSRGFDQSIPLPLAKYFAVYVSKSECCILSHEEALALYRRSSEVWDKEHELKSVKDKWRKEAAECVRLERDRSELMQQRDAVRRQRDSFKEQRDHIAHRLGARIEELERELGLAKKGQGSVILNFGNLFIKGGSA